MLICIPTRNENGVDSKVYGHFGSAPFFVLFDTDQKTVTFLDNSNSHHVHGQCNPVGQLRNYKVDAVVVNGMGMNALRQLNNSGIKVYKLIDHSTIRQLIDNYEKYLNQELSYDDCCSHQGMHHSHN